MPYDVTRSHWSTIYHPIWMIVHNSLHVICTSQEPRVPTLTRHYIGMVACACVKLSTRMILVVSHDAKTNFRNTCKYKTEYIYRGLLTRIIHKANKGILKVLYISVTLWGYTFPYIMLSPFYMFVFLLNEQFASCILKHISKCLPLKWWFHRWTNLIYFDSAHYQKVTVHSKGNAL